MYYYAVTSLSVKDLKVWCAAETAKLKYCLILLSEISKCQCLVTWWYRFAVFSFLTVSKALGLGLVLLAWHGTARLMDHT